MPALSPDPVAPTTAPRVLVVELPLPPRECSPNWTGHWRPEYQAKKIAREQSRVEGLRVATKAGFTSSLNGPVHLSAEFYMKRGLHSYLYYHPRDEDNAIASLKAQIDGLVESGAIFGDDARNLKIDGVKLYSRAKEHKGRSCVVITLTEEVPSLAL